MSGHRYKVGQIVHYISRETTSGTYSGNYKVTQLLPPEGAVYQYRIKNANEPHERVVKEHELSRAA
jgi:predicted porin